MKKFTFSVITMALLLAGPAFAAGPSATDPFASCTAASNYGYDTSRSMVSASYNRANCDRSLASQYETFLEAILPQYLGGIQTTPTKFACLFQGSYEGWLDALSDEYADCEGVPGFDGIPRATVGGVAAALCDPLWAGAPSYVTPAVVEDVFTYDYSSLDLTGERYECEARVRGQLSGIPAELVNILVATVCV